MEAAEQRFIDDTQKHKRRVQILMRKLSSEIYRAGRNHDASKLEDPEKSKFVAVLAYHPDPTPYGSAGYSARLHDLNYSGALDDHYAHNAHHPEHSPYGIRGMNLINVCEMLCDWLEACSRHPDDDPFTSIEINQKRFGFSDDLKQVMLNTIRFLAKGD